MKICVYAISKNEEQFVERFINSSKDADLILIADTGSIDRTVVKAFEHGAMYATSRMMAQQISITPWRFDLARNAALALIPRDIDVCVSLDLDEELQPGWREEIERVWKLGETTRLRYMFDWGLGIAFKYEKIHARHGYKWHHPCHEYPMPYGIDEVWADTDKLLVVHKPDPTKSRAQYLPLLKLSVEEDPHCPRNAFYYARELGFHGFHREAISEAERYLALPRATWANERCYARRVQGRSWTALGDLDKAYMAFMDAAREAPHTREPWCELAGITYKLARWGESYAFAMRALAITDREKVYTVDPAVWGYQPHDYAAIAAWNLGMKKIALEQARLALAYDTGEERLRRNLEFIEADQTC